MDPCRFDSLSRELTRARSRRGVVAALVAGALGLQGLTETTAKHHKKHKKTHPSPGVVPVASGLTSSSGLATSPSGLTPAPSERYCLANVGPTVCSCNPAVSSLCRLCYDQATVCCDLEWYSHSAMCTGLYGTGWGPCISSTTHNHARYQSLSKD